MCGYPIQDYDISCLCCPHKINVFDLYAKRPSESFVTYFCLYRWPGHGLSPTIFLLPSASHQQFTKAFDLPQQCNKALPQLEQTIRTTYPGPLVQIDFGLQTAISSCFNSLRGACLSLDPLLVFQIELKCHLQRFMLIFPWKLPGAFIHAYACPLFHQAVSHALIFLVS